MTRHTTHVRWYLAAATAALLTMPTFAAAQGARLNLDALASLAPGAADVTDVTLDPTMLHLASGFLSSDGSDQANANIKELVAGLQGVYVKNFEFKQAGTFDAGVVDPIRKQLTAPGWSKMVSTRESDGSVDVYLWREGETPGGLAVLVVEPKEVTVVNIVGRIDLQKLAALGGQMGIPKLPIAK
jgi:hypothetical protein